VRQVPPPQPIVDLEHPRRGRDREAAAGGEREAAGERRGRADGAVEGVLARRCGRVEDHQGAAAGAGVEAALDHLAGAGDGRPVDPRCGTALAIGAQAVDFDLDRGGAAPRRLALGQEPERPAGPTAVGPDLDRLEARQDEDRCRPFGRDRPLAEAERIAHHGCGRPERLASPPRPPGGEGRAAGKRRADGERLGQQRVAELDQRWRDAPGLDLERELDRLVLGDARPLRQPAQAHGRGGEPDPDGADGGK
jgi:hypothetical protein